MKLPHRAENIDPMFRIYVYIYYIILYLLQCKILLKLLLILIFKQLFYEKKFTVEGSLVIEGLTVGRCNPCVTPTNGGSSRMENIASALIATRVTEP